MRATLLIILIAPLLVAAQFNVTYTIEDSYVHVAYDALLAAESLSISLPEDAQAIMVGNQTLPYSSRITLQGSGASNLTYTTTTMLEGRSSAYFIADLSRIDAQIDTVRVTLPPRAILESPLTNPRPSAHPRPTTTTTDGERITLVWSDNATEPSRALFIQYVPNNSVSLTLMVALILGGVLFAAAVILMRGRTRTQEKTMNLYGDEKRLVKILLDAPEDGLWQNELVKASGLTKVKVSRKLRSLEQKGVIEKIPHGNTNRIRLS